jgi:hypothetical protein
VPYCANQSAVLIFSASFEGSVVGSIFATHRRPRKIADHPISQQFFRANRSKKSNLDYTNRPRKQGSEGVCPKLQRSVEVAFFPWVAS